MPGNPSPAWLSTEEREALTQGYGHHSRGAEHVARKLVRHAAEADDIIAGARENAESIYVQLGGGEAGDDKPMDDELFWATSQLITKTKEKLKEQAAEISRIGLIADMEIERAKTVDERNGVLFRRNIEQAEKIAALEKLSVFAGGFDLRMAESRDELKHENRFLKAEVTRLREALEAGERLAAAMETCHLCKGLLLIEGGPMHCEDCSYDCDGHEEPSCTPIDVLHGEFKRKAREALAATPATIKEKANAD